VPAPEGEREIDMVLDKLKPGMAVFEVKRATGMDTFHGKWKIWPVYIKEIDTVNGKVFASWNGNNPDWHNERRWSKWRLKRPEN